MTDFIKSYGGGVKAVGDYVLRGRGIVYGGKDLTGDRFTKDTDLGTTRSPIGMPVFYDHAMSSIRGQIGTVKAWTPTDDGIDVEIELDKRLSYIDDVMKLVRTGMLGLSTGSMSHLVVRKGGELKRWTVGEISLTPTPAEPRTFTEVKATQDDAVRNATVPLSPSDNTQSLNQNKGTTVENINQIVKDAVVDALKSVAGEPVAGGTLAAPAITAPHTVKAVPASDPYADHGYVNAYKKYVKGLHDDDDATYMRNARNDYNRINGIKSLNEGTANDGGHTVPTLVNREIIGKRDQESLLSQLAFNRITVESWKYVMPAQGTKGSAGVKTEGGSATASTSNISNSRTIQLYNYSYEWVLTDELRDDTASNIEQFIISDTARAMSVSADAYIVTNANSTGLLNRVTQSVALSASTITSAQVVGVSTGIGSGYARGTSTGWLMRNATWGALRTIDLSNYNRITDQSGGVRYVEGTKVAIAEDMGAVATGQKSLIYGNFFYATFVERTSGVSIERWRDTRTQQTYITASWRYGFDVTQPEAFVLGTHA